MCGNGVSEDESPRQLISEVHAALEAGIGKVK
jgi:hypothetical protein